MYAGFLKEILILLGAFARREGVESEKSIVRAVRSNCMYIGDICLIQIRNG